MPHTEANQRGSDRRTDDRRNAAQPIEFADRRQGDRRSGIDRRAARTD